MEEDKDKLELEETDTLGDNKQDQSENHKTTKTMKKLNTSSINLKDISKLQNKHNAKPKRGRGGTHNFPNKREDQKGHVIQRIGYPLINSFADSITPETRAVTDEELSNRLIEYFTFTIDNEKIPTVEGMALHLGYDVATLRRWQFGQEGSTPFRRSLIKKAKGLLAAFDAELVMENKVNPTGYIFRAKNYYGMKDVQDHVISATDPLGDKEDPEVIRKRLESGVAFEPEFKEID